MGDAVMEIFGLIVKLVFFALWPLLLLLLSYLVDKKAFNKYWQEFKSTLFK